MFSRDMVVTNEISRALSQILKLTHEYAIFYKEFDSPCLNDSTYR